MIRIKGIPVDVEIRTRTGEDALNTPVYETRWETVDNVLVGQPTSEAAPTETDLPGRAGKLELAIPKGDRHTWTDTRVRLPAPWNGVYRTVGFPRFGIEENIPLCWHAKVTVERYD